MISRQNVGFEPSGHHADCPACPPPHFLVDVDRQQPFAISSSRINKGERKREEGEGGGRGKGRRGAGGGREKGRKRGKRGKVQDTIWCLSKKIGAAPSNSHAPLLQRLGPSIAFYSSSGNSAKTMGGGSLGGGGYIFFFKSFYSNSSYKNANILCGNHKSSAPLSLAPEKGTRPPTPPPTGRLSVNQCSSPWLVRTAWQTLS